MERKQICGRMPGLLFSVVFSLLLLLALSGARGEEEICCIFRIRPEVESADRMAEEGTAMIGPDRGKNRVAQISLGTEALNAAGERVDLTELIRERGGRVLRAFWRVRVREASEPNGSFILWPRGNRAGTLQQKIRDGWNLWNVTDCVRGLLKTGEPASLRLQTKDATKDLQALFDLAGSRVYVAVALPGAERAEYAAAQSDLLDAAFSALPEDHWALEMYRETTGSLVRPRWPETGAPYAFGDRGISGMLKPFSPPEPSRYYKTYRTYLGGFDCASYLHWVEDTAGYRRQEQLRDLIRDLAGFFPVHRRRTEDWMQTLLPGDLVVMDHGSWHVGMIIGTPRMYGMTADTAPDLAGLLDRPMMIHCGEDPFVYDRFRAYIEGLSGKRVITPPDGGVTVSLLVNDLEEAPRKRTAPWGTVYGYYEVPGGQMIAYPISDCQAFAWVQPVRLRDGAYLVEDEE